MEQLSFDSDILEQTRERTQWHTRPVIYLRGRWSVLKDSIPRFKKQSVSSKDNKIQNPYLCEVIRLPLRVTESAIPVGFVSPSYGLAEHYDVALLCLKALVGDTGDLDKYICEIGLSELGEWMNFRILFSSDHSFIPADGHVMEQRLECFNSVDGSSRLKIRVMTPTC